MLLNTYLATTGVGTGGATYFFEERFEGTGYQNSWTESGTGTVNEDYTTSPLEGAQSCLISASTQQPNVLTTFSSDQAELWGFLRFRLDTALSGARQWFKLRDSTTATVGAVNMVLTTNTWTAIIGANSATTTVDSIVVGTDYNVWWHWKKGTGANAVMSVGFSTGTTEIVSGNSYSARTNGTVTVDAHDMTFGMTTTNTTGAFVIDQILISTTGTIGDNPA